MTLWDVSDRAHPYPVGGPLAGHTSLLTAVTFSPDGQTLASASSDRTVILWDVSDRDHPHPIGSPLAGAVNTVASSLDGHTLATAGADDHTVIL